MSENKINKYKLYKELYDFELKEKDTIRGQVSTSLVIVSILLTAITAFHKEFYKQNICISSKALYAIFALITLVLIFICIFKICTFLYIKKGGERFYRTINIEKIEKSFSLNSKDQSDPEKLDEVMKERIINYLIQTTKHNWKENDKRTEEQESIQKFIFWSIISFSISIIVSLIINIV